MIDPAFKLSFNPLESDLQLYPHDTWLKAVVEDQIALREVWDHGVVVSTDPPGGWRVVIDCVQPRTIYRYSQSVSEMTIRRVDVGAYRSRVYLPMTGRHNRLVLPSTIRWCCDTSYLQYGFYLEFFYNFVKPVQYERISGDH